LNKPTNQSAFSSLNLHHNLLESLTSLGYQKMTPIQAQSLPPVLAGKDVIAQAKTGSGKTAVFSLGLLEKLEVKRFCIQALVLCPTRELADQVAKEIRRLARGTQNIKVLTLCGGVPLGPQASSLKHGAHIIVGTPGRIEDHLNKGTLKFDDVNTLVLDEADRMLDMGFQLALDAITGRLPTQRQTLLFSATYPEQIKSIAKRIMTRPVVVQAETTHDSTTIQQHLYKIDDGISRVTALRLLLQKYHPGSTLVFCNTRRETEQVAAELTKHSVSALALHGDLEQRARDQILIQFANKSISVLVATDVAARGLDIETLDAVINYHIANEYEVHLHRIGRTGRAGKSGAAYTLYSENEHYKVERLESFLGHRIKTEPLPTPDLLNQPAFRPPMVTLKIGAGKKQKVRAGDILGALTGENSISGEQVGKIQLFDQWAYVAVSRDVANHALKKLTEGKMKGRSFRVWRI